VIAQDYRDWDVLIVDDGSTDRTVEAVKSRLIDDRIALIQKRHEGCAAAITNGIEHARGPVITCLGSDDKLMPDSLSAVLPAFEKDPRLGYVWTNYVDSTGDKGVSDFVPYGMTLVEALISGWWKASVQQFFRKEFYLQSERLDTSIKYAEDLQLALLIGKTGCVTLHIPKVTYWRRIHAHQITVEYNAEVVEDLRLVRRKFSKGSPVLTDLYYIGMEKELDALSSELMGIKKCFGYKLMRLYGSIIDRVLPDNTRRGELKRKIINRIRHS
jgi:glycosyltransferase involved in cell wall biosynthesis